jgi:uncharacterized protein with LGFP repeats
MRQRLTLTTALLVSVLFAWVAAPALSLRPYTPGAVDFERALPDAKRLHGVEAADPGEPAPQWISPPVAAPHRFDLVGVAGELRAVEIRVRDSGGDWGEWVEQEDATPIYVDGADEAQARAPFRPDGELHFVNVSGTSGSTADRLLNSARESINSAFIAAVSVTPAEAIAPKPAFVTRGSWGADLTEGGCIPPAPPEFGEVRAAVIHHTVNANDYTPEEAAGIVLGICRFHVYGNGWNDIGYNALVDRFGVLYEGRAGGLVNPIVGAQAQGFNSETTSIASIGDHSATGISPETQGSIVRFLAWRMGKAGINPVTKTSQLTSGGGSLSKYAAGTVVDAPRILGHGDLGLTECPGAALNAQIAAIRQLVQKRIKKYAKGKKKKKKGKGKRKKKGGKKKRQLPAR